MYIKIKVTKETIGTIGTIGTKILHYNIKKEAKFLSSLLFHTYFNIN